MPNTITQTQEVLSRTKIRRRKILRKKYKNLRVVALLLLFFTVLVIFLIMSRLNNSGIDSYYENQISASERLISKSSNPIVLSAAYARIGYIYFKVKRYPLAMVNFKRASSFKAKNSIVLYWMGRTVEAQGSVGKAIDYYEQSGKYARQTQKYLPYYELGRIYRQKKDFNKAIEFYKKSIADDNQIWNSYYELGAVYEKTGQQKLALEQYRLALKFYPTNKEANEGIKRLTAGQKQ
jgi:tetratricopeptide (TPR) repeat protein